MVILRAKSHQIVTGDVHLSKQTCSTIRFTPGSSCSFIYNPDFILIWQRWDQGVEKGGVGVIALHLFKQFNVDNYYVTHYSSNMT